MQMNVDKLSQQIEPLCSRFAALMECSEELSISQKELLMQAFFELNTALEEMKVAQEELRQQNEELQQQNQELADARAVVEVERQRYQELFEFAPDGYLVTDAEGVIQKANCAAATLLGVSQRFLVGKPLVVFVAGQHHAFYSELNRLRQVDRVKDWQVCLCPRDGETIDITVNVVVVRNWEGEPVALRWLLRDITDLKLAASFLRESNERQRLLIENVQDYAIFTLTPNGNVDSWNLGAESILGYSEAEILRQHGSCIFTPEDITEGADKKELQTAATQGRAADERWHVRSDGTRFWGSSIVTALRDKTGSLRSFLKIIRDMTERQQVEQALSRALKEQEGIMDAILDIIYVLDCNGNLLKWNKRLEAATGLEPKVLQGKSVVGFFPEAEKTTIARAMQEVFEQGKAEVEGHLIDKDEVLLPYEWKAVLLKDEAGNVIGMTGIGRDITSHKQAEKALQQVNAKLETQVQERTAQLQQALEFEAMLKRITDKVRDSLDESQILQTAVQELALVLGVSCCNTAVYDLEIGTSTICYEYAITNPAAQARMIQIAAFSEVYQQLLQGQYCQFCSITPNPARGPVAMLACPIFDDQGVLGDLWLINQPHYTFNELELRLVKQVANQCAIALRQARLYQAATAQVEELEQLNALKDDFVSTISHELRTPMSNMKMAIQMLKSSPTDERRERYLQILQAECNREIELINDLLDLQLLETTSYPKWLIEAINLQDLVLNIIEPFRVRTQQRQQTLCSSLTNDLPALISIRTNVERIVAELLNNACKYTPAGGEIILSICYKSVEAATIFTISNSAEIPTAQLPHIFDKFYRVPNADPWKQGGTGLGLALVQKLVERLKGTILVESSRGWTTFTVKLPNQPLSS